MKSPAERAADYPLIRNEIWGIFEKRGYYPQEMAGPLSNMLVELCILTSDKPLMDINRMCKAMTSDVKEMHRNMIEEKKNAVKRI